MSNKFRNAAYLTNMKNKNLAKENYLKCTQVSLIVCELKPSFTYLS